MDAIEKLKKLKANVPPGHMIETLMCEHSVILDFLNELEKVNHSIQQMKTFDRHKVEFDKLVNLAERLIGTEPHQQREEEVLFPELEKRGVFGPPQIMRMEHKELRNRKKELRELAGTVDDMEFEAFKKILDAVAKQIIHALRDHIYKENNILYPAALKVIREAKVWEKLRIDCDHIGYCCFTPNIPKSAGAGVRLDSYSESSTHSAFRAA
jgi:hypothetical protein